MASTPAGWYPDPHGQPNLRYWDGQTWTNSTQPFRPPGDHFTTAPLPNLSDGSNRQWWKRKRYFIPGGVLGAFIALTILVAIFAPAPKSKNTADPSGQFGSASNTPSLVEATSPAPAPKSSATPTPTPSRSAGL